MIEKRNLVILLVFYFFLVFASSCRVHHPQYHKKGMIITSKPTGKLPPGQVKKEMGAKSAKAYAPGQNKSSKGKDPKYKKNTKGTVSKHKKR
ncbi:MAG TPA: hypothetical protein VFG54_07130 [Prolixibacteraceae bacterium]|nr:hypothetical protein [Prolixibacteraceae bacterium]